MFRIGVRTRETYIVGNGAVADRIACDGHVDYANAVGIGTWLFAAQDGVVLDKDIVESVTRIVLSGANLVCEVLVLLMPCINVEE